MGIRVDPVDISEVRITFISFARRNGHFSNGKEAGEVVDVSRKVVSISTFS